MAVGIGKRRGRRGKCDQRADRNRPCAAHIKPFRLTGRAVPQKQRPSPCGRRQRQTPDNRGPRRNSENANDYDWFYQNVRMADALTQKGYDLNYTWGIGNHGQKQGGAIFPDIMRWLWRDTQPVSTDRNNTTERSFREAKDESKSKTAQ